MGELNDVFAARDMAAGEQLTLWVRIGIGAWIPLYLLFSLRRVYRQGWWLTVGKYLVIGTSYLALLIAFTTVMAMLGFLLL